MKHSCYKQSKQIFCIECDCDVEAVLVSGRDVYPHRPDLYTKMFWKCLHCGNFVGTHKKTGIELGCIPNKKIKNARRQIHAMLDPIWERKILDRSEVYKEISNKLGYTYHTAEIRSLEEAAKVMDIIIKIKDRVGC